MKSPYIFGSTVSTSAFTSRKSQIEHEIVMSQLPFFQTTIESLSNTQINLLKAILQGEEQYTSTVTMRTYGLGTPNNVRKNLLTLQDHDLIDRHQGNYHLLDPIFKNWMEKVYD